MNSLKSQFTYFLFFIFHCFLLRIVAQTPIRDYSQIDDQLLAHFPFYRDRDRSYAVAITYRAVANG